MKVFKKIMCAILVVLMLVTAAPMQGFVGFDIDMPDWFSGKAEAANIGTYCSTVAVDYAKKYALSYNKEWYFYVNGGDCANFVSQSLFVAGVPMTSNWHSYDYNSTAYVMNNNYTWIRAQELMDYLISIGGVRIDNPSPSDFSLGDAVFYNWNGGRIDHSAIVTAIEGGVPKVSCHSTPEMESKLNAHWTLGKNKSCAVLIKLGGETCVANNAPDYDIYKLHTSTGLYSNPGSGFITTVSYRHTVRVIEKINFGGTTWGKSTIKVPGVGLICQRVLIKDTLIECRLLICLGVGIPLSRQLALTRVLKEETALVADIRKKEKFLLADMLVNHLQLVLLLKSAKLVA